MLLSVFGDAREKFFDGDHVAASVFARFIEFGVGDSFESLKNLLMRGFNSAEQIGNRRLGSLLHDAAIPSREIKAVGDGDFTGETTIDLS